MSHTGPLKPAIIYNRLKTFCPSSIHPSIIHRLFYRASIFLNTEEASRRSFTARIENKGPIFLGGRPANSRLYTSVSHLGLRKGKVFRKISHPGIRGTHAPSCLHTVKTIPSHGASGRAHPDSNTAICCRGTWSLPGDPHPYQEAWRRQTRSAFMVINSADYTHFLLDLLPGSVYFCLFIYFQLRWYSSQTSVHPTPPPPPQTPNIHAHTRKSPT